MLRLNFPTLALTASLAAAGALYAQGPAAPADGPPPPRPPMPAPSNLQALPKDISSESLRSLMRAYSGQLGIGCGYCHAPSASGHGLDFASDAKREKVIARAMILMTADINAKYLAAALPNEKPMTVDCGTCHRGHAEPEPFVPPPHEGH